MKKTMSLVLALMLVAAVLTGCGGANNSTPEAVVKSFFDAAMAGNMNGIISCMTPETQTYVKSMLEMAKQMGQEVDPADLVGQLAGEAKSMKLDISGVEVDGDSATVGTIVTYTYEDGTTDVEESDVPCVKVDGKWYVDIGM